MSGRSRDNLLADARHAWDTFAPDIPGKASLDFEVAINNPLMEIIRRVRDRSADLLVMGSHGVSPDRGTGMLAAQCVRRVPAKVLLVRDRNTGPFKNVVACVDFSEASREALDAALRVAAQDSARPPHPARLPAAVEAPALPVVRARRGARVRPGRTGSR